VISVEDLDQGTGSDNYIEFSWHEGIKKSYYKGR
jgi:hypothetical protein